MTPVPENVLALVRVFSHPFNFCLSQPRKFKTWAPSVGASPPFYIPHRRLIPRPFRKRSSKGPRVGKINNFKYPSGPYSKPQLHRLHGVTRVDLKLSAATFQAPSCPQAPPCCPSGTTALLGPFGILHLPIYSISGSLRSSWILLTPDCTIILSPTLIH